MTLWAKGLNIKSTATLTAAATTTNTRTATVKPIKPKAFGTDSKVIDHLQVVNHF